MNRQSPRTSERYGERVAVPGSDHRRSAPRAERPRHVDLDRPATAIATWTRRQSPASARSRRADLGSAARSGHRRRARRSRQRHVALVVLVLMVTSIVSVFLMVTARVSVVDTRRSTGDPFSGVQMFVDPSSPAVQAEASLERSDPAAAALLRKITSHPAGIWLGSWIPAGQVAAAVQAVMRQAAASQSMPLLVLYAFPYRGCGGGATGGSAYERWIGQVVAGIGAGKAAVILEPDALAQYVRLDCVSPTERRNRLTVIRRAVDQLVRSPNTAVYVDAGNSSWQPATVMAPLLLAAGVGEARGFSLNVSNFHSTAAEESYGDELSALVHGAHYVIDTSRNGTATAKTWCNPPGQALGVPPIVRAGHALVDALLWIKPPGTSDGPCHGGPPAGTFWLSYALRLAANARW